MNTAARILIVDDNSDNLFVLESLLSHAGHTVISALNGAEALTIADQELPDLIMMDLDMPVMDGLEACKRLRAAPRTRNIPILILTAHALLGDEEKALNANCQGFLTKPFQATTILERVAGILQTADKRGSS